MVQLLIDNSARVDAIPSTPNGWTALQWAADIGRIDAVVLLIGFNANLNAEPGKDQGRTALQGAAGRGISKL